MQFTEITTPYEKKKMFLFKSTGNGVMTRYVEVRHVDGCLFMGQIEKREGRSYETCDLFFYLAACGAGIRIDGVPADKDVREVCGRYRGLGGSADEFIAYLDRRMEQGVYIPKNMLALAAEIKPENIGGYLSSNEEILHRREAQEAAEKAAREQADMAYVAEKNQEAQAKVDAVVQILRNDGILKNEDIEIYRSRYDYRVYSVVNHLMRRYGIKVPLRTQGWINDKLATATIRDGVCAHVQYRKTKNGKGSQAVFGFLSELAQAARKEAAYESVA